MEDKRIEALKWLYEWSKIVDGIFGVLTFSRWNPNFALRTARKISRLRTEILISKMK